MPKNLRIRLLIVVKKAIRGENNLINNPNSPDTFRAIASACLVASILGVISQNIKIPKAEIIVATILPILGPRITTAKVVNTTEIIIFTRLLPIRIAAINLSSFRSNLSSDFAPRTLWLIRYLKRNLLTINTEVSARAKKKESKAHTPTIIIDIK